MGIPKVSVCRCLLRHSKPLTFPFPPPDDVLLENMLLTIEPVICEFEPDVEMLEDGWTVRTEDQGRTAQFEHTILVHKDHAEILT